MAKIPSFAALLACSFPVCGFAATVTFDFESSSNAATITGTGISSGPLTEGGSGNPGPSAVYARLTSTTASPADTTLVRGFMPSTVTDTTSPPVSTSNSYVQFTLAPEAGQTLDFSSATFSFLLGAATSHTSGNIATYARAGFQINSGSWTSLGASASTTTATFNAATPNWSSTTGYTTTSTYDITQTQTDISLASQITGLNPDDTVTFRIALGDNSSVNNITTNALVKSLYLDNISVSGVVVPEPSALLLGGIGVGALVLRRRKI